MQKQNKNFMYATKKQKGILAWILGMGSTNTDRVVVAVTAIVGISVLAALRVVDSNAVVGLYYTIVGFMLGHSIGTASEKLKNESK